MPEVMTKIVKRFIICFQPVSVVSLVLLICMVLIECCQQRIWDSIMCFDLPYPKACNSNLEWHCSMFLQILKDIPRMTSVAHLFQQTDVQEVSIERLSVHFIILPTPPHPFPPYFYLASANCNVMTISMKILGLFPDI